MFDSRALRRIFGAERDEVTKKWRKLRNEELYDVYSSPNIIWLRRRWTGHVARMGDRAYRVLVGRPNGKRPLERSKRRWECNIKISF